LDKRAIYEYHVVLHEREVAKIPSESHGLHV